MLTNLGLITDVKTLGHDTKVAGHTLYTDARNIYHDIRPSHLQNLAVQSGVNIQTLDLASGGDTIFNFHSGNRISLPPLVGADGRLYYVSLI